MTLKTEEEMNKVIEKLNDLLDEEGRLNPEAHAETKGIVDGLMWALGEHDDLDFYLEED